MTLQAQVREQSESAPAEPADTGPEKKAGEKAAPEYRVLDGRVLHLVGALRKLADSRDTSTASRRALAILRRSVRNPIAAAPYVNPSLGDGESRRDEKWFYLIASLFSIHPLHTDGPGGSVGHAFRQAVERGASAEAMERRFLAFLGATVERLPQELVSVITLMDQQKIPLNYYRLLDDCRLWYLREKPRQLALGRDYYRSANVDPKPATVKPDAAKA